MFGAVTDKFRTLFSKLVSQKKLTEDNITDAINDVRLALLEADVQFSVVKTLIRRVKEKAIGQEVLKSVSPGQQFIKIVHDELVFLMGNEEAELQLKRKPATILLSGLQGSGKTTHAVKLACFLKKKNKFSKPCVIACDLQRPAAKEQLKSLAEQGLVAFFSEPNTTDPVLVAKSAREKAKSEGWDLLIFDTAGRLHVDDALMQELALLKAAVEPEEILFVANAATGQDAVKTATAFNERLGITGVILTMLDGTTRSGAAISIGEVTGKPIKFEGVGEKIDDLQVFNPSSMADRILGMGDTINLVRKVQEHIEEGEAKALEQKLKTASFTYEDYLKQLQMVKKMGSMKSLLGMLPGMGSLKDLNLDDREFFKTESIILSMTPRERQERDELTMSRRKRIAKGSGTTIDDVNKLLKSFKQTKQFFKNIPNMKHVEKMFKGALWQ